MATPVAPARDERDALEALRLEALPLTGDHGDYDALLALVGDARVVLLGEASHGTHEFYRERARITKEYYRTMLGDQAASWNLRDRHMAETLDQLMAHLDRHDATSRVVVWEHNSHIGDARATEMARRGELNIGQLMRERHGRDAVLVGFTTSRGTVTAASGWGADAERKRVIPALAGSYEALFHDAGMPAFLLCPLDAGRCGRILREPRLERAIGVIYRPETERQSHWFAASLTAQFDALVHLDVTRAVEPLERTQAWELREPPETYPSAL